MILPIVVCVLVNVVTVQSDGYVQRYEQIPIVQENQCSTDHIKKALSSISECKPRDVVIHLPWPNNTDIQQMTPSHVLVKQCTGGCTPLEPACLPTRTRVKQVPVLVAKCGITQGICDKECSTVELEEHVECKCACGLSPHDCTADQDFVQSECTCKCRNVHEQHACLESGKTWNSTSCSCSCAPHSCLPHEILEPASCACVAHENAATRTILNMTNEELMSLEVMIIIFLISTVTVLFLLLFCLALKLKRIKGIQERKHLVPSTLSGYSAGSSPLTHGSLYRERKPCADLNTRGREPCTESRGRDPCTDSSQCSNSSQSSNNLSLQSMEAVPSHPNLAIRTGTLSRSARSPREITRNQYRLVPNSDGGL